MNWKTPAYLIIILFTSVQLFGQTDSTIVDDEITDGNIIVEDEITEGNIIVEDEITEGNITEEGDIKTSIGTGHTD